MRDILAKNRGVLAISAAVGFAMAGVGIVVPVRVLYAESRGAGLAVIGAMASAYLLSNFLFQYPIGLLADRLGKRRVMVAGLAGMIVLTLLYLVVSDPWLFVGLRFVEGLFAGGVLTPARALLADDVPEGKRGRAYGVYNSFLNGGFLLGPALGGALASIGYSPAFIASAAFRLAAIVLVLAFVRGGSGPVGREHAGSSVPRRALWTLPLVGAYVLFFGDSLFLGFDLTLMPLWMRGHLGASVTLIGVGYAAWAFPNMVLAPWGGRIADRMRRSRLIILFGLLQVPCEIGYAVSTSLALVLGILVAHGAIYAMMQPAIDSHLAAASPGAIRGRVQGLYGAVGTAAAFLAAGSLSWLYGIEYRLPFVVLATLFACSVVVGGALVRASERRGLVPVPGGPVSAVPETA